MRNRRIMIAAFLVLVTAGAIWLGTGRADRGAPALTVKAAHGDFEVVVTTTGELRASKFVEIQAPTGTQQLNVYQMKISSLVPEGTVVQAGDVVAELDRSGVAAKFSEISLALEKAEAQFEQALLDSTLTLSQAREELRSMSYTVEEKRISKEQSKYEAPSVQRQAEIDLEKAERALSQAKTDLVTKRQQSEAKIREVSADVERQRALLAIVEKVSSEFTIRAPEPGMVIYEKEWNGKKRVAGSTVSPWNPTVATLPDLTQMESVTYVNEIDVRKIAMGQPVNVSLDSDPSKRLTGTVTSVANVGEQRPNADAKVFEVKITIAEADTTLRPGMTTANSIVTSKVPDALSIPIEAIFNEEDTPFVYERRGNKTVRQQVETGLMNDNSVIVLRGLENGAEVFLSPPPAGESFETALFEGAPAKQSSPENRLAPDGLQPAKADSVTNIPVGAERLSPGPTEMHAASADSVTSLPGGAERPAPGPTETHSASNERRAG